MSNTVQHKLLNYEAAPPAGAWEKIAAELDESELSQNFPLKLRQHEINPPVATWQAIAAALSGGISNTIGEKLANAEATPPAHNWKKIEAALDAEKETAVPERRFVVPFLKYAAAAAVVGLVIFGGIKFFSGSNKQASSLASTEKVKPSVDVTTPDNTPAPTETIELSANTPAESAVALAEEKRNDAALEASKKTFARLDVPSTSKLRRIASGYHFASAVNAANASADNDNISSRYITVTMPDCNVVRMSKKLEHLTCCVSGEVVDKNCINQVEKWRKQLANSSTGHPANFMDILDLVDVLADDK